MKNSENPAAGKRSTRAILITLVSDLQPKTRAEHAFQLVERALLRTLFAGMTPIFNPLGNALRRSPSQPSTHLQMISPLNMERSPPTILDEGS